MATRRDEKGVVTSGGEDGVTWSTGQGDYKTPSEWKVSETAKGRLASGSNYWN